MALKRVTMQDIGNACGLSRNTVSKVFNNHSGVPEVTRKQVLEMARELGYYTRIDEASPSAEGGKTIAVLTQRKANIHRFATVFITSFSNQISRSGFTMSIFELSPVEVASRTLPSHLKLDEIAGLLGIELFEREYHEMLCALKKPTVFVDSYARASEHLIGCDHISMENLASERILVRRMIQRGARRIGFVGDIEHCNSFYERWVGYRSSLLEAGLTADPALCILEKDSALYGDTDWLLSQLDRMPSMPDAFACANDFLAIHLMNALKKEGLSIPSDVMVTGFDGSVEATMVEPPLTTARSPDAEMGRMAASLLFERMRNPERPFCWLNVKTTPIWGASVP